MFDSQGKVIGGIGLGIGLENREILSNTANFVATLTEQTSSTIEELANSASQLANQQSHLLDLATEIIEQISETEKIIEIIRGVAHTSNMLGLNASIEAARAGELSSTMEELAESANKLKQASSVVIG